MRDPVQGQGWFQQTLVRTLLAIGRLPPWLRPAAIGALLLFLMTCFRGVLLIVFHPGLKSLLGFLLALIVASTGGAMAGLAFVAVRLPLKPLGRVGELLTGIILTYVYLFGILIPAKCLFGDDTLQSQSDWIIAAIIATAFGIIVTVVYWINVRKQGGF